MRTEDAARLHAHGLRPEEKEDVCWMQEEEEEEAAERKCDATTFIYRVILKSCRTDGSVKQTRDGDSETGAAAGLCSRSFLVVGPKVSFSLCSAECFQGSFHILVWGCLSADISSDGWVETDTATAAATANTISLLSFSIPSPLTSPLALCLSLFLSASSPTPSFVLGLAL
jgi:hypothetical protein